MAIRKYTAKIDNLTPAFQRQFLALYDLVQERYNKGFRDGRYGHQAGAWHYDPVDDYGYALYHVWEELRRLCFYPEVKLEDVLQRAEDAGYSRGMKQKEREEKA